MDIDTEFNKLSIKNNCNICNTEINNPNNFICDYCSLKLEFLYDDMGLKCIYCQYYIDYQQAYIYPNCLYNKEKINPL